MDDVSYAPPRVATFRGDIAIRTVFAVVEQASTQLLLLIEGLRSRSTRGRESGRVRRLSSRFQFARGLFLSSLQGSQDLESLEE